MYKKNERTLKRQRQKYSYGSIKEGLSLKSLDNTMLNKASICDMTEFPSNPFNEFRNLGKQCPPVYSCYSKLIQLLVLRL